MVKGPRTGSIRIARAQDTVPQRMGHCAAKHDRLSMLTTITPLSVYTVIIPYESGHKTVAFACQVWLPPLATSNYIKPHVTPTKPPPPPPHLHVGSLKHLWCYITLLAPLIYNAHVLARIMNSPFSR